MKKLHILIAFAAVFSAQWAKGQFSVTSTAKNGQGKINVHSVIKDMKPMSKGTSIIEVSSNSSMWPIVQTKTDSVWSATKSLDATIPVSVTDPIYFYVQTRTITVDTSGKLDTASTGKAIPVLVTPKFIAPSFTWNPLVVSMSDAILQVNLHSGYDTTRVKVYISYNDTNYANPSSYYYKDSAWAKVGPNQIWNLNFKLLMNTPNYYFSLKIQATNSVGTVISKKIWGKTLDQPAGAMVSSPYNLKSWSDSISFMDETVATGVATKHTAYIAKSLVAKPFDSVVVMIPAGQPDGIILRNSFKKLTSLTDYYVWSAVKNSMNTVPFVSNRVLVQTSKVMITRFKLAIDSTRHTGTSTESIYFDAEIPEGSSAHVVILGRVWPGGLTTVVLGDMVIASSSKKNVAYYRNCIKGVTYEITIYGSDANHTRDYDAWEVQDTFKFFPNYTGATNNLKKETIKVYPNPAKDVIYSDQPITLYNSLGVAVGSGTEIFIENLPRDFYYYKALGQNTFSGKVMLE